MKLIKHLKIFENLFIKIRKANYRTVEISAEETDDL